MRLLVVVSCCCYCSCGYCVRTWKNIDMAGNQTPAISCGSLAGEAVVPSC